MFRSITMTAVAALLAGPVFAEGVNYARLSYDYSNFSQGSDDIALGVVQGAVEYETGQFLLSGDLTNNNLDGELNLTSYGLGAGYMITPEALVGLGLTGAESDQSGVDGVNGFEGFAQYQTGQFGVAVNASKFNSDDDNVVTTFYGEFEASPGVTLGAVVNTQSEFDGSAYTLSVDYEAGPIDARSFYNGNSESDAGIFGARGTYEITPQFRAGASFTTTTGDDTDDLSSFAIGGGYMITDGFWVDADYGQADLGGDDIDRVQVAFTFDMGEQKRIDRSFRQDAVDDAQSGFLAIFPTF